MACGACTSGWIARRSGATKTASGGSAMTSTLGAEDVCGAMAWMRMPGQTWPGAAAAFLGMWLVMTIAMMLPALLPALLEYRRTIYRPGAPRAALTVTM